MDALPFVATAAAVLGGVWVSRKSAERHKSRELKRVGTLSYLGGSHLERKDVAGTSSSEAVEIFKVEHLEDIHGRDLDTYASPLEARAWPINKNFVGRHEHVLTARSVACEEECGRLTPRQFLKAGPARRIYWHPSEVKAVIVTCGGVCPGLNTVVRELVMCLHHVYGVRSVWGARNGYRGLYETPLEALTPARVSSIHTMGGTFLGSSRGGFNLDKIISALEANEINHLYIIGGDGTHRGALALWEGIMKRGLNITVAAVPKTIDNDIPLIDKSFGFDTAVEQAVKPIHCAHNEARSAPGGVGLVKLMGRQSGFIALAASLASRDTNVVLVPEAEFTLPALLAHLESRLRKRDHAVIVVAEGASVSGLSRETGEVDESGNPKYHDIGPLLKDAILKHMDEVGVKTTVKYIDPTYMIRSTPANASDSVLCTSLAFSAVHGAFAGRTGFTVGVVQGQAVWLPIAAVASRPPRRVDILGTEYAKCMLATGQPRLDVMPGDGGSGEH
jgi:6-phosphofructokinase 1